MNGEPLVSILLLSMNHEKFIRQCIDTLINQTYKNIQIVYLDNVSSDKTYEIGTSMLEASGIPFKSFKNNQSKGISRNLNFLLDHADGMCVCPLSADDWLTLDSIGQKVQHIISMPEFGMVHSLIYQYADDTETLTKIKPGKKRNWTATELLADNGINGLGCLIRKDLLNEVGKWDENSPIEDWDLWIRIAEKSRIGMVKQHLGFHRQSHGGNVSKNVDFMFRGRMYILNKYSHYNIQPVIKDEADYKSYFYATHQPGLESLSFILKNFKFNSFYLRQVVKASIGIPKSGLTKIKNLMPG